MGCTEREAGLEMHSIRRPPLPPHHHTAARTSPSAADASTARTSQAGTLEKHWKLQSQRESLRDSREQREAEMTTPTPGCRSSPIGQVDSLQQKEGPGRLLHSVVIVHLHGRGWKEAVCPGLEFSQLWDDLRNSPAVGWQALECRPSLPSHLPVSLSLAAQYSQGSP